MASLLARQGAMWSTAMFPTLRMKKKNLCTEAHIAHGYFIILSHLKYLLYKPNKYLFTETEQIKSTGKSFLLYVFPLLFFGLESE